MVRCPHRRCGRGRAPTSAGTAPPRHSRVLIDGFVMATLVRMPISPTAMLRRDLRQYGVEAGGKRWGITSDDALRITSGLSLPPAVVGQVMRRYAAVATSVAAAPARMRPRR